MSEPRMRPPELIRRVLRRLLPRQRGVEIVAELDREYVALCTRRSRVVAVLWYVTQVLRPSTMRLAWALRRMQTVEANARAAADGRVRTRAPLSGLSLDLKLAWRMLAKTPGLTVVGILGIALGTAVGIGFFVVLSSYFYPELPLEEGDRFVALQNWDAEENEAARPTLHDFLTWREELTSVEQISAAALGNRALISGDAPERGVRAAAMTASAFQLARVRPLLGRYLLAEDERNGATPVVVLGYDLWQRDFEGDPGVIGRSVLLGRGQHVVVGVMPPGFVFPKNQEVWTALPTRATANQGQELFVFGRLAEGATREQARAELSAVARPAPADVAGANPHLRPQLVPFTYPLDDITVGTLWEATQIQLMVNLLLVAIAVNVAVLVYARTATRQSELALRAALGARRRRILAQLLVEAFVLSGLGAAVGLAAALVALRQLQAFLEGYEGFGFWVNYGVQPRSVAYALLLAVLSAVIIGVMPALKATGRKLEAAVRGLGSGASARLGWAWTALVVAQVTVAVTVLPTALHLGFGEVRMAAVRMTFPAHEFLTADIGVAVPLRAGITAEEYRQETAARYATRLPELERRLDAEPAVVGVTFSGRLADRGNLVHVEDVAGPVEHGAHTLPSTGIATNYLEVLGMRMLAGRELRAADARESGGGVVVNDAFVRRVLAGGSALGRRVRFLPAADDDERVASVATAPWHEIVGVIEDLQASVVDSEWAPPMVYYAVAPAQLSYSTLLVRVRGGDVGGFAPRLRHITTTLDPDFRLSSVGNLATMRNTRYLAMAVTVIMLVLGTVLLLSAAGIHALMSLTVTRRRKEIGIRTALGARPARVLASIFTRASWQLGLGAFLGCLFGGALLLGSGRTVPEVTIFLGVVVALMLLSGLLATAGPALRGLRIQPMETLREE